MKINCNTAWINVNTDCNLNCNWCYNRANNGTEIEIPVFSKIINELHKIGTQNIVLLGGEPTICKNYYEFLSLLREDFEFKIITHGLMFSDETFLNSSIKAGLKSVTVSLKGYDEKSFFYVTKSDCYKTLLKSLYNINNSRLFKSFIFTFNAEILRNISLESLHNFLVNNEISNIIISDTHPFFFNGKVITSTCCFDEMYSIYRYLTKRNIDVIMKLNHPLCEYNKEFVDLLIKHNKLISTCTVRKGGGLFFDSSGNLILCNTLYDIKMSQISGNMNLKSILDKLNSDKKYDLFLKCIPKCKNCLYFMFCGGSCILNWF